MTASATKTPSAAAVSLGEGACLRACGDRPPYCSCRAAAAAACSDGRPSRRLAHGGKPSRHDLCCCYCSRRSGSRAPSGQEMAAGDFCCCRGLSRCCDCAGAGVTQVCSPLPRVRPHLWHPPHHWDSDRLGAELPVLFRLDPHCSRRAIDRKNSFCGGESRVKVWRSESAVPSMVFYCMESITSCETTRKERGVG